MAQSDSVANLFDAGGSVLSARTADVGASREVRRRRRLWTLFAWIAVPTAFLWYRVLDGRPVNIFDLPSVDPLLVVPILFFTLLIAVMLGSHVGAGRSPHVLYRPEQIETTFADVKGIGPVKDEVIRSLNLFLAHKTFSQEMGGTPRRGLLFEGPPGTGKTHLAKAMAHEAGVPFLFVSATSFQSMFYGATARKIRSYFKELRKAARKEGGAIGFIEEIDAIAMRRSGLGMSAAPGAVAGSRVAGFGVPDFLPAVFAQPATVVHQIISEGSGGVVNELLVQMQSFDELTGLQRAVGKLVDRVNLLLPAHRQIAKPAPPATNVLLIAATNRGDNLDPALLRPGRFDRRLTFDLPARAGRRELIDHFLARKAHAAELMTDELRDVLASVTGGYTPVMIENLFDEALAAAVRRGARAMTWSDVEQARLTTSVGLKQPVAYTQHERALIATHESGHAVAAYLTPVDRRMEVLSIIKRGSALGMLAHGDVEEEYTRSRSDMLSFIQIALAGMAAEELWFGDVSTGPGGDLLYATNVASEMVGSVGMAGSLISYAAIQHSGLNDTNIVGRVLADPDGRARVERILDDQKQAVRKLLGRHRHLVEALRDALLDRDELVGAEITDVLVEAEAAHRREAGGAATTIDLTAMEGARLPG
ncbi:MAG TPA: AAA family ATPase [Mycobacteriales bacterium]|nr:AAA family ATPase [Mycobacteriales bacterium]